MLLITVFIFGFFFHLVKQVRKNNLDLRFACFWLLFGFLSITPVVFGKTISAELSSIGIENPGLAILAFAVVYLALITLYLTIAISKLQNKQEELIIKLAMNEKHPK